MIKRKLALTLALAGLVSLTAATAADPLEIWQPAAYFSMNFGGPAKSNAIHFGATMSLSEQATQRIYGGNTLLRAQRALKGDHSFAGDLPAYLKLDFNPGKSFSTQWMGTDMFTYDYASDRLSAPMLGWSAFSTADLWAMGITGAAIGAAGLGFGISELVSNKPVAAAVLVCAPPLVNVGGVCVFPGFP